jgi:peptidoglycan-associated lipoprotein
MSEGALKGKAVALVGRADARGEMEYNMSLGEARADSVRRYLHDLGVQHERVSATSRGEMDAMGKDETGYALDRRVDIDLAN